MRKINIGLVGFGNVGVGLLKILSEKKSLIREKTGIDFVVKKICDKDFKTRRPIKVDRKIKTKKITDILNDPEIEIIVELIGGIHPAKEIIINALKAKKHVVTANKALLAEEGSDIFKAARRYKRNIYFEASVGAGIPIIKTLRETLIANKVRGMYGIINGTSNFVLTRMSEIGCSFNTALQDAKKKGFAERNPSLDIKGIDSAHKLLILVYLAFAKLFKMEKIYIEGISQISLADIKFAKELNLVIKLLAIAKKEGNALDVRVHPTLVPKDHLLSSVSGIFNAVYINTDLMGDMLLYGQGAGQLSAASGVISDLIDLAEDIQSNSTYCKLMLSRKPLLRKLVKIDDIQSQYYIRFMAIDKPGVLAKISGVLGKYGISIASVTQKGRRRARIVPIVMLTHEVKERNMRLALDKIYKLAVIREYPVAIRMEKEL
jgi:homoserine dehydrogenase